MTIKFTRKDDYKSFFPDCNGNNSTVEFTLPEGVVCYDIVESFLFFMLATGWNKSTVIGALEEVLDQHRPESGEEDEEDENV